MPKLTILLILLSVICLNAQIMLNPNRSEILNLPVGGATPFATLDFEENSMFPDFTMYSGSGFSISGAAAHSGSYGLRLTGTSSLAHRTITAMDSVYVTLYLYIPSATTQTAGYNYNFYFGPDTTSTATRTFMATRGITDVLTEWVHGASDASPTTSTTGFVKDQWLKIKMFYKKGTGANSVHRIWVDGASVINVTTGAFTDQILSFSVTSQVTSYTGYLYVDDINLYSEDPD